VSKANEKERLKMLRRVSIQQIASVAQEVPVVPIARAQGAKIAKQMHIDIQPIVTEVEYHPP